MTSTERSRKTEAGVGRPSVRTEVYVRRVPALSLCPSCGSDLVQPLRWQHQDDGEILVELRCPECLTWMQASHSPAEMEDLDRRQTAGREQILAAYERSVAENMEALAAHLHEAFARDLVGPDDFNLPCRGMRPRATG
jgi:hypothetical protein